MNDDDLDPQTPSESLLAVSAHLDGTATSAEQALVASSPHLGELLTQLRADQAELADVYIPTTAKHDALAAAMAAFDEVHAVVAPTASAPLPANVVSLQRRRTAYRFLTAAAAVVAVAFVGIALSNGGGTDEEASTATEGPLDPAAKEHSSADAPSAAGAYEQAPVADAMTAAPEASLSASMTTSAPAATEAPAESLEATFGTDLAAIPAAGAGTGSTTITSPEQLLAFAAARTPLIPIDNQAFTCLAPGDEMLGDALYQGTPILIGRVAATGVVTGYDATTCAALITVGP
jgi:hypothetical protein